jgi:hypothetical protein
MGGSNRKCRVLEPYCSFDILPTEYFNRRQIQLGSPYNNSCGSQQLVLPQVQCPPAQLPCPAPAQLPCPQPAQLSCAFPPQVQCGGLSAQLPLGNFPLQLGAAGSPLQIGSPFLSSQSFGYNQYQNLGARPLGFQAPPQSLGRQIVNFQKKHIVGSQQIPSVPKFNQQQFQNPVAKF